MLKLRFPLVPNPKQSVKIGKNGRFFQPKEITEYKNTLKTLAISQLEVGFKPISTPVIIEYKFAFPFPKGTPKRVLTEYKESGNIYRAKRPDIDNLQKAINDALNGTVILDDSQIVGVTAYKFYSDTPRTEVKIKEVDTNCYYNWKG